MSDARHSLTTRTLAPHPPRPVGAVFPWESAWTGEETCPSWASTGLREIHISGDIAMMTWTVFRTQQTAINTTWLGSVAYP